MKAKEVGQQRKRGGGEQVESLQSIDSLLKKKHHMDDGCVNHVFFGWELKSGFIGKVYQFLGDSGGFIPT